jgi:CheY-like chemotaxis protein
VLLNLASNAAHAMRQKGGTLTVTIAAAELTPDIVQLFGGSTADAYVHITVRDTGHGMDDATRRRIFDPFFTTKNAREGTGLGLAVVHGIIRAHRGAIDVESAPGAGATFHIYLPVATSGNETVETDPVSAPGGAGENICVVDDEEVVGSCTKLVLENRGYHVHVFTSGEHCLEHVLADPSSCALLVTDQTMPGMQGTDLVASMRRLNPALPVVIMSGYFSKISPQTLDELGQVDLLAKPFTTDELLNTIHRCLHPEPAKS